MIENLFCYKLNLKGKKRQKKDKKKEKEKKRVTCFATLRKLFFLDFHSTKQGLPLADSWSRDLG